MSEQYVSVGRVSGLYGVKGWVKVFSYTQPRENIVSYQPWLLQRNSQTVRYEVDAGGAHGKGVIAHLAGIDDRDAAAALIGADILVQRDQFGDTGENEYFWADLVGLKVQTMTGEALGVVDSLLETGAHDVLVIQGERRHLVPFVMDEVVKEVDLSTRRIVVDWDPEF